MPLYSIAVLEYGTKSTFYDSEALYTQHNKGAGGLSLSYILIKGQGRIALIDCGFNLSGYGIELAQMAAIENFHTAQEVLGECGIAPADITDILITHAHYDHMGGLDNFPNAKVYVQQEELSKWIWALTLDRKFRWITGAIDPADIQRAVGLTREGRLFAVDGVMENVLPGVDLFPAFDTHTAGSQYVLIRNDGQARTHDGWCVTGDITYRFENVEGLDPVDPEYIATGYAQGSQTKMILTMDEMVGHVRGETHRVIPPHEPRLAVRFPSRITKYGLNIVEIAVGDGQSSLVS